VPLPASASNGCSADRQARPLSSAHAVDRVGLTA
jgi:hypothetical protein